MADNHARYGSENAPATLHASGLPVARRPASGIPSSPSSTRMSNTAEQANNTTPPRRQTSMLPRPRPSTAPQPNCPVQRRESSIPQRQPSIITQPSSFVQPSAIAQRRQTTAPQPLQPTIISSSQPTSDTLTPPITSRPSPRRSSSTSPRRQTTGIPSPRARIVEPLTPTSLSPTAFPSGSPLGSPISFSPRLSSIEENGLFGGDQSVTTESTSQQNSPRALNPVEDAHGFDNIEGSFNGDEVSVIVSMISDAGEESVDNGNSSNHDGSNGGSLDDNDAPVASPLTPATPISIEDKTEAVNFLQVVGNDSPLSGTWKVDTTLPTPSDLPPLDPDDGERPNLCLNAYNASVSALVELIGETDEKARIVASSSNGSCSVMLLNPADQPVDLHITSHLDHATVYLPLGFEGHITASSTTGRIIFSPAIQHNLALLSDADGTVKASLRLKQPQPGQETPEAECDQLVISAKDADVCVYYFSELEESGPPPAVPVDEDVYTVGPVARPSTANIAEHEQRQQPSSATITEVEHARKDQDGHSVEDTEHDGNDDESAWVDQSSVGEEEEEQNTSENESTDDELAPTTNYLQIVKQDRSITGSWKIDTSLPLPPKPLPPLERGDEGQRPNLRLSAHDGSVTALVEVTGGTRERAKIVAKSCNGSCTIQLVNPTTQPVDLRMSTRNGRATVYLPRSFTGPLTVISHNRRVSFSPAIQRNLTIFSDEDGTVVAFLDSVQSRSRRKSIDWKGDRLEITSRFRNGNVNVHYLDELGEGSKPEPADVVANARAAQLRATRTRKTRAGVVRADDVPQIEHPDAAAALTAALSIVLTAAGEAVAAASSGDTAAAGAAQARIAAASTRITTAARQLAAEATGVATPDVW